MILKLSCNNLNINFKQICAHNVNLCLKKVVKMRIYHKFLSHADFILSFSVNDDDSKAH